jgi:uncharacterized membrane protein
VLELVRWIHLVAAAVWLGGMITLAASVLALRRAGAPREHLQAVARQFGRVSWTAMALAAITGVAQVQLQGRDWADPRLEQKVGLVVLVIAGALAHTRTATRTPPALRGAIEAGLLALSLAIYAAAVRL